MTVRYVEARDGRNWENWRDRLRDALSWVYPIRRSSTTSDLRRRDGEGPDLGVRAFLTLRAGAASPAALEALLLDAVGLHHVVVLVLEDVAVEHVGSGEMLDGSALGVTGEGCGDAGCGASEGDQDPGDLSWRGEHGVLPAAFVGHGWGGFAQQVSGG